MEFKSEWENELEKALEFKEFFERQTRRSVSYEIMNFADKSREAGRSEHFLSGLETAAKITNRSFEQDQMTLLELFSLEHPAGD